MPSHIRYYIPVCLYPHTKYRTTTGLSALFRKFALSDHDHLIVVADQLLALDRLVAGRYWTVSSAHSKAGREGEQILRLIRRTSVKERASGRGQIVRWDNVAGTTEYLNFSKQLQHAVLQDRVLTGAIEDFVERRVARYGLDASRERERDYEREYLLSEVSMSVYCTEKLGFSTEVWERAPQADAPDPLKLLYRDRPYIVSAITGRPTTRVLNFLFTGEESAAASETYEPDRAGG